jgi:hypothetical protein
MSKITADRNIDARTLSRLYCNAAFRTLNDSESSGEYIRRLKKTLLWDSTEFKGKSTVKDLIEAGYQYLLKEYRHEYLYKAALLNDFVLANYSLKDTVLLNEFRIGKSKADAVLVNGTNKVFEIKTELDSPERLNSQLSDYYKIFSQVYIITHHSLAGKYSKVLSSKVGLIIFTESGKIEIYREAEICNKDLDNATMLKSLRKNEYLDMIKTISGGIPNVTPVKLFSSCIELLEKFDPIEVQKAFMIVIKKRINLEKNAIISDNRIPGYLKFSCYHNNLDLKSYQGFIKILNTQL